MEYQKIINLVDNTPNQSFKLKAKNWVEINDESIGTHSEDNQIRFKTSMLRSILCDYSDVYILAKETITVRSIAIQDTANNAGNKKVTFKNYASFTKCIRRIK